jgi:hypothetical protein
MIEADYHRDVPDIAVNGELGCLTHADEELVALDPC